MVLGGRRSPVRQRRLRILSLLAVIGAVLSFGVLTIAGPHPGGAGLAEVGPVSSEHGFPVWYKDTNGTRLELCLDPLDPMCAFLPGDFPDANAPVSFPDNFPGEAFWMLGGAAMDTNNGGSALLTIALEAAFAQENPAPGDQVVFGRVRIWVDNLQPGATYVVTHPYGQDTFLVTEAERRGIRMTEDIGIGPKGFAGALDSRIGPFLTWAPLSEAPAGYIGDPNVEHRVTGSPYNTNYFRIEGPNVGEPGSPFLCNPTGPNPLDCIETDLFSLMGKFATNSDLSVERAYYSRTSLSNGSIDIYATSEADQSLQVVSNPDAGFYTTLLRADGTRYYGRVEYSGTLPSQITVANVSDVPRTTKVIQPIDRVVITRADYDSNAQTLTIEADSSDRATPAPILTVNSFNVDLVNGSVVIANIAAAPSVISVRSSAGGSDISPVRVDGAAFSPISVLAVAGTDQEVQQGGLVTLNAAASSGDITSYSWAQTGGTPVVLSDPSSPSPTFLAPLALDQLTFELTVSGPTGSASDDVTIRTLAVQAPVANAGADQSVVRGTAVTVDGATSENAATFGWTQLSGPAVVLNVNGSRASFIYPNSATPVVLQLTVTNAAGSATDTVTLTPRVDTLQFTSAQYTRNTREWRVRGTSTIFNAPNTVTVYLGATCSGTVLGTSVVDAIGAWEVRLTNNIVAANNQRVSACSTAGGSRVNFAVRIR